MFLELKNNFLSVGKRRIDTLIDQARVNIFSVETDGLFFDYSKTNIDLETRSKLLELVINTDVISKRDAMFSGKKINLSEDRAVLHTALRKSTGQVFVDGEDVIPAVLKTRTRMFDFSDDVQTGKVSGQVVNTLTLLISVLVVRTWVQPWLIWLLNHIKKGRSVTM